MRLLSVSASVCVLPMLLLGCEAAAPTSVPANQADDPALVPALLQLHDDNDDEIRVALEGIVSGWSREDDWMVSPVLTATRGVTRVGALIEMAGLGAAPQFEARLVHKDSGEGAWQPLVATWSEDRLSVAVANFGTKGEGAQLRIPVDQVDQIRKLQYSAVVPLDGDGNPTSGFGTQSAPLSTALSGLGIVERSAWKARATKCTGSDKSKYRIAIHHTETPSDNAPSRVRGIQAYHMDSRGWCDIGYHFLVAADGTVFEGRPIHLLGAHTSGQNSGNIGVSFIGCLHPTGCTSMPPSVPPGAMVDAGGRLLGTLADLYGIALSSTTVKGHRDHAGASTTCPGDNLHAKIGTLITTGKTSTLASPPAGSGGGTGGGTGGGNGGGGGTTPTVVCKDLPCGLCSPLAGCAWCGSRGVCGEGKDACTWTGFVDIDACWTGGFWPCAVGTCWNPKHDVPACGTFSQNEDFSSGKFNVHRYWATLPKGEPITLTLQNTGGTWQPALIVTDQAGNMAVGGDPVSLHPDIAISAVTSGRTGSTASVTLVAKKNIAGFVYVTAWNVLDAGFHGKIPQTAKYSVAFTQSCAVTPQPGGQGDALKVHAGLTQGGSEIPRAGLANGTLQSALGLATEPYGSTVAFAGLQWVKGLVSEFGGPNDTGVTATETGAVSGEILRNLNKPLNPDAATLAANLPGYYYIAMRWNYAPNGKSSWKSARILVTNPANGLSVVVRPVDWGPHTSTKRVGDLSPQVLKDLGLQTDDNALFAFAQPGTPLGLVAGKVTGP